MCVKSTIYVQRPFSNIKLKTFSKKSTYAQVEIVTPTITRCFIGRVEYSQTEDFSTAATLLTSAKIIDQEQGPLQPLVLALEETLKFIQLGLDRLDVPYSYGWSIICMTLLVKLLTFPLSKKQIESSIATQKLKPELDALRSRYGEDKDRIQKETAILYQEARVNPLAGCLPSLATIPIFIGLYRSLSSVANEGTLDTEGFYWIPSLAGPITLEARKMGSGTAWLFPLVDGHPPIGWQDATAYLVLPILLVVIQYVDMILINTQQLDENEEQKGTRKLLKLLPLMLGWFSINVPSGLCLYYFSNVSLTIVQQIYLKKLGGAKVVVNMPSMPAGKAVRSGELVSNDEIKVIPNSSFNSDKLMHKASEYNAGVKSRFNETVDSYEKTSTELKAIDIRYDQRCKRKKHVKQIIDFSSFKITNNDSPDEALVISSEE